MRCLFLTVPVLFSLASAFPLDLQTIFSWSSAPSHRPQVDDNASEFPNGWHDPRIHGGRFLDYATNSDCGEPLNVIISAKSDPFILTEEGMHYYSKSIGFSEECLGIHYGFIHEADLGDGDGRKEEQILARQYYFPVWGTCWESLAGGQHFRAWRQNGSQANSGAWFIGASLEQDSSKNHMIVPNGYNLGRDWLVERAISGSHWKGKWWKAEVEWRNDLLPPGNEGVNHGIKQDGWVAILTVNRL
ncbi:hypothetical protein FISHEDRAFT_75334 [Fistulina hepatica ATCC 64428]|uniref:Secreted protein n=1 Tax=Fistulina hepatica ATCC 64428 TaxID=1128425 RepID=A0A0D7A6S1_9AGAR|nr:hypothetical protein FISHEDRAFT_75334 [Fistulina hepatica ATCC 64428]